LIKIKIKFGKGQDFVPFLFFGYIFKLNLNPKFYYPYELSID
jgi:hypothetical protein